jgi:hypothetical protein
MAIGLVVAVGIGFVVLLAVAIIDRKNNPKPKSRQPEARSGRR